MKFYKLQVFGLVRLTLIIVLFFLFGNTIQCQSLMSDNPAAQYCKLLGYNYRIEKDSLGAEHGICVFPDSSTAEEWSFYYGEVKPEYSYCAKKGLSVVCITDSSDGFLTKCAYCYSGNPNNKIAVRDLMIQNGDIEEKSESIDDIFYQNSYDNVYVTSRDISSFPSSFDWRSYNGHSYIGPVRNQGGCGSCYAFATVASAEGTFNFDWGLYDENVIELSESFIMWCLGSLPDYQPYFSGCDGSNLLRKEVEALTTVGVCLRSLFPYQTVPPDSCYHWNDTRVKFSDWYRISCNDIASMKDAIMKYGIISTAVLDDERFHRYNHGVFKNKDTLCLGNPCGSIGMNHVVAIVGWGKDNEDGEYWIVRNSWGAGWGESGYMRISMKSSRIACNATVLIPEPATYISDYSNHSSIIASGHNAKTIGTEEIILSSGFQAENGSEYVATIQQLPIIR